MESTKYETQYHKTTYTYTILIEFFISNTLNFTTVRTPRNTSEILDCVRSKVYVLKFGSISDYKVAKSIEKQISYFGNVHEP